jgi:hypothetical protein
VTGGGGLKAALAGVPDDEEGGRHIVVLTLEGGKHIGVRACGGEEHTVISRKAAQLYGLDREILARSFKVKEPPVIPV